MKNPKKSERRFLLSKIRDSHIDQMVDLVTTKQRMFIWWIIVIGFLLCIGFLTMYGILIYTRHQNFEVRDVVQILAACVSVPTFLITIVQISNYLYHSKLQVTLKRKSDSIEIARLYAESIIFDINFVIRVLDNTLSENQIRQLRAHVPDVFTKDVYNRAAIEPDIEAVFSNEEHVIKVSDIVASSFMSKSWCERYASFNNADIKIEGTDEIDVNKEYNRRFRCLILQTLNELEWFAMEINEDVAESELLFGPLSYTYLQFVEEVYPMICLRNTGSHERYYGNVVRLYRSWSAKRMEISGNFDLLYKNRTRSRK